MRNVCAFVQKRCISVASTQTAEDDGTLVCVGGCRSVGVWVLTCAAGNQSITADADRETPESLFHLLQFPFLHPSLPRPAKTMRPNEGIDVDALAQLARVDEERQLRRTMDLVAAAAMVRGWQAPCAQRVRAY